MARTFLARHRLVNNFIAGTALLAAFSLPVRAELPETPPERKAAEVLSADIATGDRYRVMSPVASDGVVNLYVVQSDFGSFEAAGTTALRKLITELDALAELETLSRTDVFARAVARSGVDTVKSFGSLLTRPGETISSLPAGVGRLFAGTKRTVERGMRTASDMATGAETDTAEALFIRNRQISDGERRWARRLGVDPYSTNLVLRDAISNIALIDASGSFTVNLVIPMIASLSASVLEQVAEDVWSLSPESLGEKNAERLVEAGLDAEDIDRIQQNIWYTPTTRTILSISIAALGGAEGIPAIAGPANAVSSYAEAQFITETIAMMAWYHEGVAPLDQVMVTEGLPHAFDADDRHVVLLPGDTLYATDDTLALARALASQVDASSSRFWVNGTFSEAAVAALSDDGWATRAAVMPDLGARMRLR